MKPITDAVVHSLLEGIAAREKSRRPARRPEKRTNNAPAKIIKFIGPAVKKGSVAIETKGARRTISGVYCYVSQFGSGKKTSD